MIISPVPIEMATEKDVGRLFSRVKDMNSLSALFVSFDEESRQKAIFVHLDYENEDFVKDLQRIKRVSSLESLKARFVSGSTIPH